VAVEENPTLGRSLWSNEAGNVQVIVGGFEYRSDAGKHNPAPYGYRFVVFGMGIANGTNHSIHVNPLNVTLVDQTGLTYAYHAVSQSWCTMPLGPVDVGPGDHAEGSLVFLIALSSWPARIIYRTSAIGTDVVVNVEREPTA
jgi:hypothetical protein